MRPDVRRDPDALDRAARGLADLAAGLTEAPVTGPGDGDRAVRLRRVADELASLADAARRAAATARVADTAAAAAFRDAPDLRHGPGPGGAGPC
ncbi:hypothetical protein FVA95_08815 [Pseudonocardia sp. EV170527-09]|uniref:hypothetical protein n=1 Tax=Pseudonocardia sp. EV170527-09 TaxID=2603411 RepID=UPI0011F3B966|nr:hypothetical protein [Pseudonocardia sp. EV170527-09]KAA1031104.1 hypothetical protein FVA95_08815 [Pseudonocardia sp. EV170527-09]